MFQCKDLLQAQRIKTLLAPPLLCLPPLRVIFLLILIILLIMIITWCRVSRIQKQILILTNRQRRGYRADIDDDGRPEVVQTFFTFVQVLFFYICLFFLYLPRLYKLVKWCKSLPLFKNILIDDQVIIILLIKITSTIDKIINEQWPWISRE